MAKTQKEPVTIICGSFQGTVPLEKLTRQSKKLEACAYPVVDSIYFDGYSHQTMASLVEFCINGKVKSINDMENLMELCDDWKFVEFKKYLLNKASPLDLECPDDPIIKLDESDFGPGPSTSRQNPVKHVVHPVELSEDIEVGQEPQVTPPMARSTSMQAPPASAKTPAPPPYQTYSQKNTTKDKKCTIS